jgi:hypothetical protein
MRRRSASAACGTAPTPIGDEQLRRLADPRQARSQLTLGQLLQRSPRLGVQNVDVDADFGTGK